MKVKMESNISKSESCEAVLKQLLERVLLDNDAKDIQILSLSGASDVSKECEATLVMTIKLLKNDLKSKEGKVNELALKFAVVSEQ